MVSRTRKAPVAFSDSSTPAYPHTQAVVASQDASGATVVVNSGRVQGRTKAQELSERLENLARRLGPGAQLPTVVELCRDFGVSRMTLQSAVISLEEQGILHRRHGVGVFVSAQVEPSTCRIMLLCDASLVQSAEQSDFWSALLGHIRQRGAEKREELLLHFAPPGDSPPARLNAWSASVIELLKSGHYSGVLGIHLPTWPQSSLFQLGVPVVMYASYSPHRVETDWKAAVCVAVKALWEAGCHNIGLWSGATPHQALAQEDIQGWQQAYRKLEEQGTPIEPAQRENNAPKCDSALLMSQQQQGFETAMRVFSRPRAQWPDGVYIAEDTTTRGALAAFKQLGIEVGRDVMLASQVNRGSDALHGHESRMILVEFDPVEIVSAMFNLLESLMDGETIHNPILVVPPRLIA